MKKAIVIVCVLLIIIGLAGMIAGVALGGNFGNVIGDLKNFSWNWGIWSETDYTEQTRDFAEASGLEIDISWGELRIEPGDNLRVEAYNIRENKFECYLDSKRHIVISYDENYGSTYKKDPVFVVYIPSEYFLNEGKISTGAGSVQIDGLTTKSLSLSVGAGEISGKNLYTESCEIKGGVGAVHYSGVVAGNCKVEGGIGEIKMDLIGVKDDYEFDIEVGIGEAKVFGSSFGGIGGSVHHMGNSDAPYAFSIHCGIGSIIIDMEETQ